MDETELDFDFDAEAETSGTLAAAQAKLQKIKAELQSCKEERQEFLDGWQRLRAEIANQKRDDAASTSRIKNIVREEVLEDLLPALDAFDMAMQGDAWGKVDAAWRSGVEYIHTQLVGALEKHEVMAFGKPGDAYSPHEHEAIAEEPGEGSTRVLTVRRRGYKLHDRILRPAQVTITGSDTTQT
ncbi:MAG: nucleotide exchange factor GrpE [Candidatus Pacebacteria bacterium]|nr:nucleotide exchange factor GrpE [Candidatus Paceibacterota bacterium]